MEVADVNSSKKVQLEYINNYYIAIIRFNNPEKLNSLTDQLVDHFIEVINEITTNNVVRVVILTGNGNAFCAGGDLDFLIARGQHTEEDNEKTMSNLYRRVLYPLRALRVPIIAAINGAAVGGGACIAIAADLRIMAIEAKIAFNFTRIGFHPGMAATYYLPKLIGIQKATELLLTGEPIPAIEAKNIGLITDCVPLTELMNSAITLANKISVSSPVAVQTLIKTLRETTDFQLENTLHRESAAQAYCFTKPDLIEGIKAIKEKKKNSKI